MSASRTRLALVLGGANSEHQVSCLTAASVCAALDPARFEVVGVGIGRDGRWWRLDAEQIQGLVIEGRTMPSLDALVEAGLAPCALVPTGGGADLMGFAPDGGVGERCGVDVVFSLLHGPFGEDGAVQGQLEMLGVPYVGSGIAASAIGMDKHLMKVAFAAAGVPIGPYVAVESLRWREDREGVLAEVAELTFPVYVKPARGGSSMGIVRVTEPGQVPAAVAEAQRFDPKVVIEQGVVGREIELAVLGNPGELAVSSPGEIVLHTEDRFYDFTSKYLPDETVELVAGAAVGEAEMAELRRLAVAAFAAIGAEGLARVDCFLCEDRTVLLNEVNTMPGFTPTSMFPALWAHDGLAYPDLVARLVELALARPRGLR